MGSLNGLVMNLGAGYITIALFAAAALFAVLWLRTRKQLGQTTLLVLEKEAELDQKSKDREQVFIITQSQVSKLKERIQELSRQAYLTRFEPDHVYTLTARAEAEIDGKPSCFGLVGRDDRTIVPFLIHGGIEDIEVGDKFSLVDGRLTTVAPLRREPRQDVPLVSPHVSSTAPPRVTSHDSARAPAAPRDKRPMADFGWEGSDVTIMAPSPGASFGPEDYYRGLPYLKVTEGKQKDALFYLPFIQGKIGRDQTNTVALDDERSSRIHAFIDYREHGFVLRDNHSTNGTYLNGNQIEEARLNFGDVIMVGDTRLVFTSDGYELREKSPEEAISMFEKCLSVEPSFILGLKYLAFLLERDVRRQGESEPIYARLKRLEKSS